MVKESRYMSKANKQLKELAHLFKSNIVTAVKSGDDFKIEKELIVAFRAIEIKIKEEAIEKAFDHVEDLKKTLRY